MNDREQESQPLLNIIYFISKIIDNIFQVTAFEFTDYPDINIIFKDLQSTS